jgi:predicted signal transduction protein with EAL and GGDEF domain/CHASE2 domain-containing sensor protein
MPPRRARPPGHSERQFPVALARNLVLGALAAAATAAGGFAPADRFLADQRFALASTPASGRIALVEIDSRSLDDIGVWPWPRALHGVLVDRLVALGARCIVFDIDFSGESTQSNDKAFADALGRAKGRAWLAAFERPGAAKGRAALSAPIPILANEAPAVSIDVPLATDGLVRDYYTALDLAGTPLPTVGALLAGRAGGRGQRFGIDYGLDLGGVPRLSAADVLAGRAPRPLVSGRDVIVGASAAELRDVFLTPRYGALPGLAVHALAAETLLGGRALRNAPTASIVALILALAILAAALERGAAPQATVARLALAGFGLEACALGLHKWAALTAPTAGAQIALAAFALGALVSALRLRRRQHAEAARERDVTRAMLAQVIADNFDGVVVIDGDGLILGASAPAREILGRRVSGSAVEALPFALAEAVAAALDPASPGRGASFGEAQLPGRDGAMRFLDYVVTISAVPEAPERRVICLTFRDVTERRAHVARLDYLARHDELTGAFTRAELIDNMHERLRTDTAGLTLYCAALRRFDLVNDVFGPRVGDLLLMAVVERLRGLGFTLVGRLGGARFAFAAPGAADTAELPALSAALVDRLARPYLVEGRPVIVGACLGATTSALSGADAAAMLSHARMAQSTAARRVGDVFAVFSPEMETRRREKQALDAELRRAVADGSLDLHFQGKVDLASGRLTGAEALLRWRKSDGGAVSPTVFVPLAEESGLIVELGRFALRRACAEAAAWPQDCTVAVNVSPVQFGLSDVFADVREALREAGLAPERLEIEITESGFVEGDAAITAALGRLRELGVKIALDDFGTGYSSLHYLGRLPIDTIKIDQSFVRAMHLEAGAAATVAAIVALAKAHDKRLVAEGIETAEDATLLKAMGCECGQGYHFARPLDGLAFLTRLMKRERAAA